MKTTGKIFSIEIDGEKIGTITEYECDAVPYSGTAEIETDDYTWLVFCAYIYSLVYRS